ncbi:MAG: SpaH/EbpB family LPXTG-anchored major pilin [Candidatus Fimadaptatus sp.]
MDIFLRYNKDIAVELGENALTSGTDYSVNVDGQKITVTVNAGTIANYPVEAHLSITYSAGVDTDAVYDNTNTVSMSWTVYPNGDDGKPDKDKDPYDPNDPDDPNNPGKDPEDPDKPGDSKTDTYVFGFKLQKYKESVAEGNELTGAKFRLYADATGGTAIELVKVSDGVYRVAVTNEQDTTTEEQGTTTEGQSTTTEIEAGFAKIFGLDAKTYYLEETVAPAGYNMLTGHVAVAIYSDAEYHTNGIMNDTNNIINNAGTLLPSTGGMGTTLFYVLGSLLAVCAVVLLIAKRRMTRAER